MEPVRKKKSFYTYTKEELDSAISDVKGDILTVSAASRKYNIPRQSLNRRLENPQTNIWGRNPTLSIEAEIELVEWATYLDEVGQGLLKEEFLKKAAELGSIEQPGNLKFKAELPSRGWLQKFMKRHPVLSFRKPSYLSKASAVVSEKDIRAYYGKIYDYLLSNDLLYLLEHPERWLNGDETNFQLNAMPPKVISTKGKKVVYRIEKAKPKESVTGMYTFSADGYMYKPLYVLSEKVTNIPDIANACIEIGAQFGFAQTGAKKFFFSTYVVQY